MLKSKGPRMAKTFLKNKVQGVGRRWKETSLIRLKPYYKGKGVNDSVVLTQRQTNRPMAHNREPRNESCIYRNLINNRDVTVDHWEKINSAEKINSHIQKANGRGPSPSCQVN